MAAAAGVTLPAEYLATAATEGIKKSATAAYIALHGSVLAGALAKAMPWFRDRLVYDNRFLFKVGAEVRCSFLHMHFHCVSITKSLLEGRLVG